MALTKQGLKSIGLIVCEGFKDNGIPILQDFYDKLSSRMDVLDSRMDKLESQMFTKSYLDEKLANLKGWVVIR